MFAILWFTMVSLVVLVGFIYLGVILRHWYLSQKKDKVKNGSQDSLPRTH